MNPGEAGVPTGWNFRANHNVTQVRNNDDKDVFRGDIGRITRIDP